MMTKEALQSKLKDLASQCKSWINVLNVAICITKAIYC